MVINMNVYELLYNEGMERDEPISFYEYQQIGWDIKDFINYVQLCERIRAFSIVNDDQLQSEVYPAYSKEYIAKSIEVLQQKILKLMFKNEKQESELKPFAIPYMMNIASFFSPYPGDFITMLYRNSDDIRCIIENTLARAVSNQETFIYHENQISLDQLKKRLHDLQQREKQAWDFDRKQIPDFASYQQLSEWVKMYSDAHTEELDEDIEKCKKQIQQRENSSVFIYRDHFLYIYQNKPSCVDNNHSIQKVDIKVPILNNEYANVTVNFCETCHRFFLTQQEYESYLNLYHYLFVKLRLVDSQNAEKDLQYTLSFYGYNVNQIFVYNDERRQEILSALLDYRIVTKNDLQNCIETFIVMNGQKIGNECAKQRWKKDLEFIRNYTLCPPPTLPEEILPSYKNYVEDLKQRAEAANKKVKE